MFQMKSGRKAKVGQSLANLGLIVVSFDVTYLWFAFVFRQKASLQTICLFVKGFDWRQS